MGDLSLYLSAAPEVDAECELLGQLLARLVPSIRWTIKRTPGPFGAHPLDLPALEASDFFVLILGMDIVAPVGIEWQLARQVGMRAFCFRKRKVLPTPAAAVFARDAGATWFTYNSPQELVSDLEERLIEALLDGTPGYGLDADEVAGLVSRWQAINRQNEESSKDDSSLPDGRRGAGGGGVILAADTLTD